MHPLILLTIGLISGSICGVIADGKGRSPWLFIVLGFFSPLIGFIAVGLAKKNLSLHYQVRSPEPLPPRDPPNPEAW